MSEVRSVDPSLVLLRLAKPRDWPAINTLLEVTWWASYKPIMGAARAYLGRHFFPILAWLIAGSVRVSPAYKAVVADRCGKIIAVASADKTPCGRGIMLWELYVLPEEQNLGIGRELFENMVTRFSDVAFVQLQVLPKNTGAIRFYERLGFQQIGRSFHLATFATVLNMRQVR